MTFGFNFFFLSSTAGFGERPQTASVFYLYFQASLSPWPPPSPSILFFEILSVRVSLLAPQHSSHSFTCWGFPLAGCAADALQPEYGQDICIFLAADGPRMPNSVVFFLFLSLPASDWSTF